MKIALFGCTYSANLGDGLLSLCLAREMEMANPDLTVVLHDLAGRTEYGEGGLRRSIALLVLNRIPRVARASVMALLLGFEISQKLRPAWVVALSDVDAAVLGGGNLLADAELNFPLKIAGLGSELRRREIPWAVFGVGASAPWTKRGRQLFESALLAPEIKYVAVRDLRSQSIWDDAFTAKGAMRALVCPDPAVLTCDHFPTVRSRRRERQVLGLNVTAPQELSMHSNLSLGARGSLLEWWLALITLAVEARYEVRIFTNGSLQDEEYLCRLKACLKKSRIDPSRCIFLQRPRTPEALAASISDCDVVAGHRLHAHIAAYSYRIPSVGFAWDIKVRSFFESVDRGEFVLDPGTTPVDEALQCIFHAQSIGLSEQTWLAVTRGARRNVAELVAAILAAAIKPDQQEAVFDV